MEQKQPSFLRRLFTKTMLLVFVGAGGAYVANDVFLEPRHALERQIAAKNEEIAKLQQDKERLDGYLRLLRQTERRARLEVLHQSKDSEGQTLNTLRFTEVDADGNPLGQSRDLQMVGDEVYLDMLVIKFEDHFVEHGDPLKGHSLVLLRRLFTNRIKPDEGYALDKSGMAPEAYAAEKALTPFEKDLWTKFWQIANDSEMAKKMGVKAVHGQAVYGKLEPRKVYYLTLRSTGESTLAPPVDLKPDNATPHAGPG